MKNLTKLSLATLLALFLTACDKPNTAQQAQSSAQTATQADPATDFLKFIDWQKAQEAAQANIQAEIQQKLSSVQNPKELEPVLQNFSAKMNEMAQSLDALDIQSPEIKNLKEKAKVVLLLSSETMADTLKMIGAPSEDSQKALQEKAQKLMSLATELQQLQSDLAQKFSVK